MEAKKNRPLYGCTNCYEDYSWPSVDLAVYEGECWCENCWDERRWEGGDLPYFSDLDDFVPEHEKQLQAERERVRVLREGMEHIAEYWNRDQNETAMADALWHIIESAEAALQATAQEGE